MMMMMMRRRRRRRRRRRSLFVPYTLTLGRATVSGGTLLALEIRYSGQIFDRCFGVLIVLLEPVAL